MICNMLLSWALVLLSIGPLLAHPVSNSADMAYSGPEPVEDAGTEEFFVSDVNSLLQRAAALGYSPMFSREGLKVTGLLPKEAAKEKSTTRSCGMASTMHPIDCSHYVYTNKVLLENPGHLTSLGHLLGLKQPYRKRANGADCFWKYCV